MGPGCESTRRRGSDRLQVYEEAEDPRSEEVPETHRNEELHRPAVRERRGEHKLGKRLACRRDTQFNHGFCNSILVMKTRCSKSRKDKV